MSTNACAYRSAAATMAASKTYSLAEVSAHKTKQSCWMVMDKKVYDVTKWLPDVRTHASHCTSSLDLT